MPWPGAPARPRAPAVAGAREGRRLRGGRALERAGAGGRAWFLERGSGRVAGKGR